MGMFSVSSGSMAFGGHGFEGISGVEHSSRYGWDKIPCSYVTNSRVCIDPLKELKEEQKIFRNVFIKDYLGLKKPGDRIVFLNYLSQVRENVSKLKGKKLDKYISDFLAKHVLSCENNCDSRLMKILFTPSKIEECAKNGSMIAKAIKKEKEKAHFTKLYEVIKKESEIAQKLLKEKLKKIKTDKSLTQEKAHFDKLYEGVKNESEVAQAALKEKLKNYKADKKFAQETAQVVENAKYKASIKQARRIHSKNAERAHFVDVFRNIQEESKVAQAALKEKLAVKKAAKQAAKEAEKSHFTKVFENIDKESKQAQAALKEKLKQVKAKKGIFKKTFAAIKKNKIAAGIAAAIAVAGGVAYVMSGSNNKNENQQQIAEEKINQNTTIKYNV